MGEIAPKPVTKESSAHWPQWSANAGEASGELPAPEEAPLGCLIKREGRGALCAGASNARSFSYTISNLQTTLCYWENTPAHSHSLPYSPGGA